MNCLSPSEGGQLFCSQVRAHWRWGWPKNRSSRGSIAVPFLHCCGRIRAVSKGTSGQNVFSQTWTGLNEDEMLTNLREAQRKTTPHFHGKESVRWFEHQVRRRGFDISCWEKAIGQTEDRWKQYISASCSNTVYPWANILTFCVLWSPRARLYLCTGQGMSKCC